MGNVREKMREDRRNQILSISLDLFIRKGYYGTSTRGIAAEAGVSSGLIFNYFRTKDEIYETLIRIGVEEMSFDYELASQNPYAYLSNMVENIFHQLETNPFYAKMFVFIEQALHTAGLSKPASALLSRMNLTEDLCTIIECGQQKKQFREGNPKALSTAFLSVIQGIAQEKVHKGEIPFPKKEWVMDILTGGQRLSSPQSK